MKLFFLIFSAKKYYLACFRSEKSDFFGLQYPAAPFRHDGYNPPDNSRPLRLSSGDRHSSLQRQT